MSTLFFDWIQNKLLLISFNSELNKSGGLRGKKKILIRLIVGSEMCSKTKSYN